MSAKNNAVVIIIVLVAFILIFAVAFITYILISLIRRKYVKNIPIIPRNSIFGYMKFLIHDGDNHRTHLNTAIRLGPLVQFNLFGAHRFCVYDKKLAKVVLKTVDEKVILVKQNGRMLDGIKSLTPPSMFNIETGPHWQLRRNAFKHSFSMSFLRNFHGIIRGLSEEVVDILDEKISVGRAPVPVDVLFGQLTIDVICKVGFGMDIHALKNSALFQELHETMTEYFKVVWISGIPYGSLIMQSPFKNKYFKKFADCRKRISAFCRLILEHLRNLAQSAGDRDLSLGCLGRAMLDFSQLPDISEENVLAEIELMFIAGHETTAHTLSFVVYSLARNPAVQARAQKEVDAFLAENASGAHTFPPYLEAVIKESMRKYPTAGTVTHRKVTAKEGVKLDLSHLIGKYWITPENCTVVLPYNSFITVSTFALHNWADNWGPDVDEFRPERWLAPSHLGTESSPSAEREDGGDGDGNPLTSAAIFSGGGKDPSEIIFSPFSHGLRSCIGMNLALLETRMVMMQLVRHFSFELADDSMRDETVALENRFTMRPKDGLPVWITRRSARSSGQI